MEDERVAVDELVIALEVREGAVLLLVRGDLEVMSYVGQGPRYLDTEMFGALSIHERASKVKFEGRARTTEYGAWQLFQEEWRKVKEQFVKGMDMPVFRDESEALYVSKL